MTFQDESVSGPFLPRMDFLIISLSASLNLLPTSFTPTPSIILPKILPALGLAFWLNWAKLPCHLSWFTIMFYWKKSAS